MKSKEIAIIGMSIVVVILLLYSIVYQPTGNVASGDSQLTKFAHWHTKLIFIACNEFLELPKTDDANKAIGKQSLHTHNLGMIHKEGPLDEVKDKTLGEFFDAVGVEFSSKRIKYNDVEYKNGDLCGIIPGKLKMLVNGIEENGFGDYIVEDGDTILIRFD